MRLKSKLLLVLWVISAAAFAQTAPALASSTLSYNVGVVSEYRYRGLAQTKGDPALQGGADYTHSSGWYVGAWASTIKWIKDTAPSGSNPQAKGPLELDLYGGYKFEAAGLAYDVGYLRYEYVGNTLKDAGYVNANTDEAYAAGTYGPATLKYSYTLSELFGNPNSRGSSYWDLSATFDLGSGYSLVPHVGRQMVKNAPGISYNDYALTLSKDLGKGLSASVAAIDTNGNGENFKNAYTSKYEVSKSALVVGVKYTF